MSLEDYRWIYLLYSECSEVLTEEERKIYFAHDLQLINDRIKEESQKLVEQLQESLGLIRHSECILDLAYQRTVLKDCVDIAANPKQLKEQYSLIPKKKLIVMRELESMLSRENEKIS